MFHCLNTLQFIYLFNQWWTFDSSLELLWIVLLCALCTCVSGTYSCFFASRMPRNNAARVQLDTGSVQLLSRVRLFATPWTVARRASLFITNSWSLFKLTSIESVMPSNHLILCCPFSPLPSIFPSIRVFSNESILCIRWPKYWSFSFSISPSNVVRMDWLDLLAAEGTLKSFLQHYSSKASILRCSAFFIV